jgi:hypothetical protein
LKSFAVVFSSLLVLVSVAYADTTDDVKKNIANLDKIVLEEIRKIPTDDLMDADVLKSVVGFQLAFREANRLIKEQPAKTVPASQPVVITPDQKQVDKIVAGVRESLPELIATLATKRLQGLFAGDKIAEVTTVGSVPAVGAVVHYFANKKTPVDVKSELMVTLSEDKVLGLQLVSGQRLQSTLVAGLKIKVDETSEDVEFRMGVEVSADIYTQVLQKVFGKKEVVVVTQAVLKGFGDGEESTQKALRATLAGTLRQLLDTRAGKEYMTQEAQEAAAEAAEKSFAADCKGPLDQKCKAFVASDAGKKFMKARMDAQAKALRNGQNPGALLPDDPEKAKEAVVDDMVSLGHALYTNLSTPYVRVLLKEQLSYMFAEEKTSKEDFLKSGREAVEELAPPVVDFSEELWRKLIEEID